MQITLNDAIYAESATTRQMDDATIFTMAGTGATLDDLRRADGKAELVNGEIVRMTPAGGFHHFASLAIRDSLHDYAWRTGRGRAFADGAGFVVDLPHRRSFSPDAAYAVAAVTRDFVQGAPVFAVEIRSNEDYGPAAEGRMARKRADYFAAGTLVVWDVDVERDGVIRSYGTSEPSSPLVFRRGETAHAEPAVPGWWMPVDDVFRYLE